MAESTKTTMPYALSPAGKSQQQRYTIAALVYFLYGLFYLFERNISPTCRRQSGRCLTQGSSLPLSVAGGLTAAADL